MNGLPNVGDVFEFDYTDGNENTQVVKVIVVEVNAEHVLYKIPSVSINKIFPMTHEYWMLNYDGRRSCMETTK